MLRVLRSSASKFVTSAPPPRRFSSIADSDSFQKIQVPRLRNFTRKTFDAYVVGKHDAPPIIVLQDWLGVDYHVKNHALKISQLGSGFKVVIPDVYAGMSYRLFWGLHWFNAKKDVLSLADWLKMDGAKKVGVTGFSKGSALAIAACSLNKDVIDAVVAFYGVPYNVSSTISCNCPVQAHFGKLDECVGFTDVEIVKELKKILEKSEVPYEVNEYAGQGHAFMNRSPERIKGQNSMLTKKTGGKNSIGIRNENEAAVQLAWSRVEKWMTNYLSS